MQILQPSEPTAESVSEIRVGDLIQVRRQRWRVVDLRPYEGCQLVTVTGTGGVNAGAERHFLLPFDTLQKLGPATAIRFVRPRRWRRACRALLADQPSPGGLETARRARIELLPHQLEPALAVVRGYGSRVLLADDVGLGKTIQAGLIMSELAARGMADRILIVTPAGLREQWVAELSGRFGIDAAVVDFRDVRRRAAGFPVGVNPWSTVPVAVASIDYIKRPEVLRSVASCHWDLLTLDEAHGAAPDSERHAAVAALADRTPNVLLLTATPHSGERRAFQALCQTGSHGDPLLVFRRTRADVALGTNRHVHRLQVRLSDAEAHMHELLQDFTRAVHVDRRSDDVWLALSVLHKRALSSAGSLAQSIERRLATLGTAERAGGHRQLVLPLDTGGEHDAADAAPVWASDLALNDPERESHLLRALADAARDAARHETKFSSILRLLRRVDEPVVIFTEYRDTLLHLRDALRRPVCILHGGLARDERTSALQDFLNGRCQVLLATDAAGEGLNLHQRCRIVVNLELPWNPMRLEQRIGRVDRIGQRRTIHVFHLIARASGEGRILDRLESRIARASEDIRVPNPLTDERQFAQFVMQASADHKRASPNVDEPAPDTGGRVAIRLEREAASEAARLTLARRASDDRDEAVRASLEITGAWVARARLRRTRQQLGSRAIAILRVEQEDGRGRVCDWTLLPVAIRFGPNWQRTGVREVRSLLRDVQATLQAKARDAGVGRFGETERFWTALINTRLARERAIALAVLNVPRTPLQAGLFDRRAEFEYLADRAALGESARDISLRIDAWRRAAVLSARAARLLLVLAP